MVVVAVAVDAVTVAVADAVNAAVVAFVAVAAADDVWWYHE